MSAVTVTNKHRADEARRDTPSPAFVLWLAPATIVAFAIAMTHERAGWPQMWATAFSIYFACKAWVLLDAMRNGNRLELRGVVLFLFAWAGMDARPFAVTAQRLDQMRRIERISWIEGLVKLLSGIALLLIAPVAQSRIGAYAAAWLCASAYVLILHFGLLHLIGFAFQRRGLAVEPIMQRPARSVSLMDFWSRRWNRAFRDVGNTLLVRPTRRLLGPAGAIGLVFFASGLVHELLMSWPARGGWGLPTAYFTLQGVGVFIERCRIGRRLGLARGVKGRVWTAFVVIAPLPLLVHGPFVERVVIPFFKMVGAMR